VLETSLHRLSWIQSWIIYIGGLGGLVQEAKDAKRVKDSLSIFSTSRLYEKQNNTIIFIINILCKKRNA